MIISYIVGGLGNQMFQYAFAYSISKKIKQEIKFDVSAYSNKKYINPEGFLLKKIFNIEDEIANPHDYFKVMGAVSPLLKFKNKIDISKFSSNFLKEEKIFTYDEAILNKLKDNIYLFGSWQVPKYFHEYKDEIRSIFTINNELIDESYLDKLDEIKKNESVSVHVRMGDYKNNPTVKKMYDVCDEKYYSKAIDLMKKENPSSKFYLFSDDIEKVRSMKIFSDFDYIENQNVSSWNDLFLMSNCKHSIIANSSFSWWGAYLKKNHDTLTIAPSTWLASETKTPDNLPPNWLKI